jgi:hypothetical protein
MSAAAKKNFACPHLPRDPRAALRAARQPIARSFVRRGAAVVAMS